MEWSIDLGQSSDHSDRYNEDFSMRSVLLQKTQVGFKCWKNDIYFQTSAPKLQWRYQPWQRSRTPEHRFDLIQAVIAHRSYVSCCHIAGMFWLQGSKYILWVCALFSGAGIKSRTDPVTITQQLFLLIILRQGIFEMTALCYQQLSSAAPI